MTTQAELELTPLPTTREEWEERYPGKNTRWLAWCNAMRKNPETAGGAEDNADFMGWTGRHAVDFRKARGMGRYQSFTEDDHVEWTEYLWGISYAR